MTPAAPPPAHSSVLPALRLARYAMGSRFEIAIDPLAGDREAHLRACGEAALDTIEALDRRLSLFRRDSLLSFINREAAQGPVRLDAEIFELLRVCLEVHRVSEGAFDITVAPLMRCWGFHAAESGGELDAPTEGTLASVLAHVGMQHLVLDARERTLRFAVLGLAIDLGGVAKGHALDEAAAILREEGVRRALLHGGSSTVVELGEGPQSARDGGPSDEPEIGEGWKVGIRDPLGAEDSLLAVVTLRDRALSVSALHGRSVSANGRNYGHLLDPRTGRPAEGVLLVAVIAASATRADAWSTALAAAGPARFEELVGRASEIEAALMVCAPDAAPDPPPACRSCGRDAVPPPLSAASCGPPPLLAGPSCAPDPPVAGPSWAPDLLLAGPSREIFKLV
ncbi:MAG: FAD:protein FMN transferase [Planctomycetota bacterium]